MINQTTISRLLLIRPSCKQNYMGIPSRLLKESQPQLAKNLFSPFVPFLFFPVCEVDVMAGAPAAILQYKLTFKRENPGPGSWSKAIGARGSYDIEVNMSALDCPPLDLLSRKKINLKLKLLHLHDTRVTIIQNRPSLNPVKFAFCAPHERLQIKSTSKRYQEHLCPLQ